MNRWHDGRKPIKKIPRWVMATLLAVYIISLTVMFMPKIFGQTQKQPASFASSYMQYVVEPGDTLHDIARRLYPGRDWREIVHEVREVNGITPVIHPGQVIFIPIGGTKEK